MEGYICSSSNSPGLFLSSSSPSLNSLRHHHWSNSFLPFNGTKQASPMLSQTHRSIPGAVCGCSVAELERELEWIETEMEMGTGKCEEEEGRKLVEVLESLEREAIMGDDKGRDPDDYNRRAQIFDKSNRVFQALKKHAQQQHHQDPCTDSTV